MPLARLVQPCRQGSHCPRILLCLKSLAKRTSKYRLPPELLSVLLHRNLPCFRLHVLPESRLDLLRIPQVLLFRYLLLREQDLPPVARWRQTVLEGYRLEVIPTVNHLRQRLP